MAKTRGRDWTEYEIERAIDLYVQLPFGRLHQRNPEIITLAAELGRTPGSIAMKLANLASIDETLDRKGMANASDLDRIVWHNFFNQMKELGRNFPIDNIQISIPFAISENPQAGYVAGPNAGTTIRSITSVRVGQEFFRRMILASYDYKCGITGIDQRELLVAGHICTWASDAENRMNPRNGICLNRLHDKAFEERLITIDQDNRILFSKRLKSATKQKLVTLGGNGFFIEPRRFKPDPEFIGFHRDQFHFQERNA